MSILERIKNNSRKISFSAIFSLCFTVCTLGGIALDRFGTVWVNYNGAFALFIYVITFFAFFFLLEFLPQLEKLLSSVGANKYLDERFFKPTHKSFVYCFLFLVLCHLPAFLAYFPGILTYDVPIQIHFFVEKDLIESHPVLHNLMVYGVWLINQKFNTGILGILIYTMFQVTIVLAVFSYCMRVLSKYQTPFLLKLGALLFFAFYPTNQIFPLIAIKDVLFSVFVFLQVLFLIELSLDKEKFLKSKVKFCWFVITALLMFLFRHNGVYAYVLTLPMLVFFYIKRLRLNYKKIIVLFLLPILLYGGVSMIKKAYGIKPPALASSLAIPIQQLGRVRLMYDNTLSEEDKNTYRKIISPQNEFNYVPFLVDLLKFDRSSMWQHSDYIEESLRKHPEFFIRLYLKWARLYPTAYVDAFLLTNQGFWYPFANYNDLWLDYLEMYVHWGDSLFGVPLYSDSLLPQFQPFYNWIFRDKQFEKNIFTRLLFSMGINTWYLITAVFILTYKRRYDLIMPLLLPLGLLFTVLFGPIVLLRYIYQNFLILPLLVVFCMSPNTPIAKK